MRNHPRHASVSASASASASSGTVTGTPTGTSATHWTSTLATTAAITPTALALAPPPPFFHAGHPAKPRLNITIYESSGCTGNAWDIEVILGRFHIPPPPSGKIASYKLSRDIESYLLLDFFGPVEEEDEILHREGMWRDFGELQKPPEQCARLVGMGGPMKEDGTVEGGVCVEMGTVGDAECFMVRQMVE